MSVGNFAILTLVNPTSATTMPWPSEIYGNQVCVGSHWTADPVSKLARRNTLRDIFIFG